MSIVSTNKRDKVIYGVIDVEEFFDSFDYFRFALACKAITSEYAKFCFYPRRRKKRNGKALIFYNVSAEWKCYHDCSFAEYLNEYIGAYGYNDDDKETKYARESTSIKLLESNIKRDLSFFMHIDDLVALDKYICRIIRDCNLSGKLEAYIEFDLDNNKIIINKEFESEIFNKNKQKVPTFYKVGMNC
jgi:hypothetical protein